MLNSALITQSCFSLKHLSFDPTVGSRTIGWILLSLLHWAVIVSSCRKCFPLTWSSYLLGVWMAEPEPAELLRETDTGKGCRVVCKDGWSGVGGCWLTSPMWQIWWRCISVLLFFSFSIHRGIEQRVNSFPHQFLTNWVYKSSFWKSLFIKTIKKNTFSAFMSTQFQCWSYTEFDVQYVVT